VACCRSEPRKALASHANRMRRFPAQFEPFDCIVRAVADSANAAVQMVETFAENADSPEDSAHPVEYDRTQMRFVLAG
jgi:hypothetical protein